MSTPDLAARSARAVAAGRDLGLDAGEPKVLHDAFSVVVHLAPSPVVARVPMVLPPGLTRLASARARRGSSPPWPGSPKRAIP